MSKGFRPNRSILLVEEKNLIGPLQRLPNEEWCGQRRSATSGQSLVWIFSRRREVTEEGERNSAGDGRLSNILWLCYSWLEARRVKDGWGWRTAEATNSGAHWRQAFFSKQCHRDRQALGRNIEGNSNLGKWSARRESWQVSRCKGACASCWWAIMIATIATGHRLRFAKHGTSISDLWKNYYWRLIFLLSGQTLLDLSICKASQWSKYISSSMSCVRSSLAVNTVCCHTGMSDGKPVIP